MVGSEAHDKLGDLDPPAEEKEKHFHNGDHIQDPKSTRSIIKLMGPVG